MEDESNPWPSFVDTFSTVLCIFIFIMLVFVLNNMLVVYDNSVKSYQNIENQSEQKTKKMDKESATDSDESKELSFGKDTGIFDIASELGVEITASDKELTIHYHEKLGQPSIEDVAKITSWIKESQSQKFSMEVYSPQSKMSYSDSLRIGYERGIILMKEIKSVNPSLNFNMNVNTESNDSRNKVVITKE
ncbi:Uncharacterised protein [Yersinia mollaretii]|uniref:hypothetical protein n=1 Tax=Yersinia mollaretii TaxID=33060 RepID=UPI0005EA1C19|nr:hypothetical protein [Yersinia mollaretii]CNK59865.1 Uncharacterised protein [Yersinia mollaretii]